MLAEYNFSNVPLSTRKVGENKVNKVTLRKFSQSWREGLVRQEASERNSSMIECLVNIDIEQTEGKRGF